MDTYVFIFDKLINKIDEMKSNINTYLVISHIITQLLSYDLHKYDNKKIYKL